jgi:hypothetical protein
LALLGVVDAGRELAVDDSVSPSGGTGRAHLAAWAGGPRCLKA